MGATKEEIAAVLRDAEERQAARFRKRLAVVGLALLILGVVGWKVYTMAKVRREHAEHLERMRRQSQEDSDRARENVEMLRAIQGGR